MLLRLPIVLLCLSLTVYGSLDTTAPRVKTPLGALKGYYKTSQNGRQYEAYEGIPYALPPIGKLRFQPPRRLPAWVGELSATKFGSMCIQYTEMPVVPEERVEGAEDCLYLNIYVPVRDKRQVQTPMPVIFWIHGGAFIYGTGMAMGGKYLMDHDVIYVTSNYRLGIMGFLSTEDAIVPGNMGLKDQSMALRWVSENIEWFGGDPQKITLTGLSAGGASVHYHYLSQMSAGLFQGGISMSGATFLHWPQTENALEKTMQVSAMMGCPTISTRDMIRCLRYRPARALIETTKEFMPFVDNPFTPFGPVPEKVGDVPFIDRTPFEIVSSGSVQDVPWITGVVSEEGLYPVAQFINDDRQLEILNNNWETLAPHLLDFNYTIPREKHAETARLIKEHYFGTKPIDRQNLKPLIQMAGDRFFVADSVKAAQIQAKVNTNPVWYYYYTHRAQQSLSDALSGSTVNYGVCHADDAYMVVDTPWINPTLIQQDLDMQKHVIDLWISFATNGVPKVGGVEWQKVDPSKKELDYLLMASPTEIRMDSSPNFGDKDFWDSINFNENKIVHASGIKQEL